MDSKSWTVVPADNIRVKLLAKNSQNRNTLRHHGMVAIVNRRTNAGGWAQVIIEDTGQILNWRSNAWQELPQKKPSTPKVASNPSTPKVASKPSTPKVSVLHSQPSTTHNQQAAAAASGASGNENQNDDNLDSEDNDDAEDNDAEDNDAEDSDSSVTRFSDPEIRKDILRLLGVLFPEANLRIGHISGGAFNYVYTITSRYSQFILRMPRHPKSFARFEASVAILQHVYSRINVDTPRVLKVSDDPMKPWMLLNRLDGINMTRAVYRTFSTEQACHIARQIARILVSVHSVTFVGCGTLVRSEIPAHFRSSLIVGKPQVIERDGDTCFDHVFDGKFLAPTSLLSFLVSRFKLMAAEAESRLKKGDWSNPTLFTAVFCPYLVKAVETIKSAYPLLFPANTQCVLFHPDLRPHNFLVKLPPKNKIRCRFGDQCARVSRCRFVHRGEVMSPEICGLLDWDDCEALPPALAYRVPTWLWSDGEVDEKDCSLWGISSFPYFIGQDPNTEAIPHREAVRAAFMQEIERGLPGFMKLAKDSYSSGLAALGCIARLGIGGSSATGLARGILKRIDLEDKAHEEFLHRRGQLLDNESNFVSKQLENLSL